MARREDMVFLLENLPATDLKSRSAAFLIENLNLADEGWEKSPRHARVTKEMFLNDVLPCACWSEARDPWRAQLREGCAPTVAACRTPGEAAHLLNQKTFPLLKVRYNTSRHRPEQSSSETMKSGIATCTGEVFTKTGTVWENYAPEALAPGQPAMKDFAGWTGLGPIVYLLEFAIGLKPDAHANTLTWNLASGRKTGCERYRFAGQVADLLATPEGNRWNVRVHSDGEFTLKLALGGREKTLLVQPGDNMFLIGLP